MNSGFTKRYLYSFVIALVLVFSSFSSAFSQSIALKTNTLYYLTGTLNLAGEVRCNDKFSVHVGMSYNPWEFGDNKKMKHFLVQPEARYWFDEVFFGGFVGLQAHYAKYNFAGMTPFETIKDNRFQGDLYGIGATYGYQWMLSTFWSIEASVSLGYAHFKYDKYGPDKGDPLKYKACSNYFGPTQIGLSFIYFIR